MAAAPSEYRNTALSTARAVKTIASLVPSTETPHRHLASRGHSVVTPRQMSGARRHEGKSPIYGEVDVREGRCLRGRFAGAKSYMWIEGDVRGQTSGKSPAVVYRGTVMRRRR